MAPGGSPRFPWPSLKFRTVSFPQYGFKAGILDVAFPARWFAIALRALCCHWVAPLCVGDRCAYKHLRASSFRRSTPGVLAPVRVMLSRSILTYLTPCAPLPGTSRLRRSATYTRCHRWAPTLRASRQPASGSVLSLTVLYRHVVP